MGPETRCVAVVLTAYHETVQPGAEIAFREVRLLEAGAADLLAERGGSAKRGHVRFANRAPGDKVPTC